MKMIKLLIFFLALFVDAAFAQTPELFFDKEEYKTNELIIVEFKIDSKVDSIKFPDIEGLKLVSIPSSKSSMSIKNAKTSYFNTWTYTYRIEKSGSFTMNSPVVYVNGEKIIGPHKTIKISPSLLTLAELKEIRFQNFIKDEFKPYGTMRYILGSEFGYVEMYTKLGWEFKRRLTEAEFEELKK